MKSRGERGHPYRCSLPLRKKEEDLPLTGMEKFSLTTQLMIHLIIEWLKLD
jgi:hypothetical protein